MSSAEELAQRRRTDRRITIIVASVVIGGMGLFILGVHLHEKHTHGPFSADAYFTKVQAEARSLAPDAALVSLNASYVDEQGRVQAAFSDRGYWRKAGHLVMYFHSDTHREPAPAPTPKKAVPLGAPAPSDTGGTPAKLRCPVLRLSAGLHGSLKQTHFSIDNEWREDARCAAGLPAPVKCSLAAIWKRAIAAGAPHPAFADIDLYTKAAANNWHFSIVDNSNNGQVVFVADYPDDCP